MRTTLLSILCVCFSILSVTGQWSNDPALNARIFGNNQPVYTLPKIASDVSGGFFVSTFLSTSAPDNFSVYLQRTDPNGNLLLPAGGVQVTDGPFRTWISDYKLISDADTCAIITYESMEEGPSASQVYAHRFSPSGQHLWGSSGVKLTQSPLMKYSPIAVLLTERDYIMAWSEYFDTTKSLIAMHKVDADGSLPWGNPVILLNEDSTFRCPSLLSLHDGTFIVAWFRQVKTGAQIGQEFMRYIFAQKFDKSGDPLWPEPVKICNLDTLAYTIPLEITILPMADDGTGGFFIAWYDCRTDKLNPNVYIQYVDNEGQIKWKTNGIPAIETNKKIKHVSPVLCYNKDYQTLYAFFETQDITTGIYRYCIRGQRLSIDGDLQWGDMGKDFTNLTSDTVRIFPNVIMDHDSLLLVFIEEYFQSSLSDGTTLSLIKAMKLSDDGENIWPERIRNLSTAASYKLFMDVSAVNGNQIAVAWQDERVIYPSINGYGEIFGQNLTVDGKLGPVSSIPDLQLTGNLIVLVYPNPASDKANLLIKTDQPGEISISLAMTDGRTIHTQKATLFSAGFHSIPLDLSDLPKGSYFIVINKGKDHIIKSIQKQL